MQNNLAVRLESLGLSQKEAAVYLALLTMKKGTALTVAAASGIKRPTAYLVLEALLKKKLIAVTRYRDVTDYRALPLEHLQHYVRYQKQIAGRELPGMIAAYHSRTTKLRLRVYQGASTVKLLFEKSLREKAKMHIVGRKEDFGRLLGDYWDFYLKRAAQLNLRPEFKQDSLPISLLLWSDKVAFIDTRGSVQSFGFKNKQWHEVYKKLYQLL